MVQRRKRWFSRAQNCVISGRGSAQFLLQTRILSLPPWMCPHKSDSLQNSAGRLSINFIKKTSEKLVIRNWKHSHHPNSFHLLKLDTNISTDYIEDPNRSVSMVSSLPVSMDAMEIIPLTFPNKIILLYIYHTRMNYLFILENPAKVWTESSIPENTYIPI